MYQVFELHGRAQAQKWPCTPQTTTTKLESLCFTSMNDAGQISVFQHISKQDLELGLYLFSCLDSATCRKHIARLCDIPGVYWERAKAPCNSVGPASQNRSLEDLRDVRGEA